MSPKSRSPTLYLSFRAVVKAAPTSRARLHCRRSILSCAFISFQSMKVCSPRCCRIISPSYFSNSSQSSICEGRGTLARSVMLGCFEILSNVTTIRCSLVCGFCLRLYRLTVYLERISVAALYPFSKTKNGMNIQSIISYARLWRERASEPVASKDTNMRTDVGNQGDVRV